MIDTSIHGAIESMQRIEFLDFRIYEQVKYDSVKILFLNDF